MNVAVPALQHSVLFGQAALLQTVWRLFFLIRLRTVTRRSLVVSRTLNQGGRRFCRLVCDKALFMSQKDEFLVLSFKF
jgi:hypothetical protein